MPKHKKNGYPRKLTLGKMGNRFRINFSKDDAEKIFEVAAQGKELVYKITSDPSTLKEKSVILLLEPIEPVITNEDNKEAEMTMKQIEAERIWKSGDPKKMLKLIKPLINVDDLTEEEVSKILKEETIKATEKLNKEKREALKNWKKFEELFHNLKTTGDDKR